MKTSEAARKMSEILGNKNNQIGDVDLKIAILVRDFNL